MRPACCTRELERLGGRVRAGCWPAVRAAGPHQAGVAGSSACRRRLRQPRSRRRRRRRARKMDCRCVRASRPATASSVSRRSSRASRTARSRGARPSSPRLRRRSCCRAADPGREYTWSSARGAASIRSCPRASTTTTTQVRRARTSNALRRDATQPPRSRSSRLGVRRIPSPAICRTAHGSAGTSMRDASAAPWLLEVNTANSSAMTATRRLPKASS